MVMEDIWVEKISDTLKNELTISLISLSLIFTMYLITTRQLFLRKINWSFSFNTSIVIFKLGKIIFFISVSVKVKCLEGILSVPYSYILLVG